MELWGLHAEPGHIQRPNFIQWTIPGNYSSEPFPNYSVNTADHLNFKKNNQSGKIIAASDNDFDPADERQHASHWLVTRLGGD